MKLVAWLAMPCVIELSPAASGSCPTFHSVPTCAPAPGAACFQDNPDEGCGQGALPEGLPCEGASQCELSIFRCSDWQQSSGNSITDGYVCSCDGGQWSCTDCDEDEGICAVEGGGTPGAEAGSFPGLDAAADAPLEGDAGTGGPPPACPIWGTVPTCPTAAGAQCLNGDPVDGCGTGALPTGLACTENDQCSLRIFPCPGWQADFGNDINDGYICTCLGLQWSCDKCDPDEGFCSDD
jgi:hypothetical protein